MRRHDATEQQATKTWRRIHRQHQMTQRKPASGRVGPRVEYLDFSQQLRIRFVHSPNATERPPSAVKLIQQIFNYVCVINAHQQQVVLPAVPDAALD